MSVRSKKQPRLTIELIPKTCWFSSVRTAVSKKDWDKIRFITYEKANNVCEICGNTGKKQGYKHNVECHEIWEYDDQTKTQKLNGLIALCVICHQVKHIGRAIAIGNHKQTFTQLMNVNKWTKEQTEQYISESFEIYKERSKYEWTLDISILSKEPYNIKLKPFKTRLYEVKKFKKKRKTKPKKTINKRPPKQKK
jgi:hypothetical protein